MCTVSPDRPESSDCPGALSPSPQLPVLIEQLRQVIHDLQLLARTGTPKQAEPETDVPAVKDGIRRCFYIPARVLKWEQNLLRKYKASDLRDLLERICAEFRTTVVMLKNYNPSWEAQEGFSVSLAADHILLPLNILDEVCSLLADFEEAPEK